MPAAVVSRSWTGRREAPGRPGRSPGEARTENTRVPGRAQGAHPPRDPGRDPGPVRGQQPGRAVAAPGRQGGRHRADGVLPPLRLDRGPRAWPWSRSRSSRCARCCATYAAANPTYQNIVDSSVRVLGRARPLPARPLRVHRPRADGRSAGGAGGDPPPDRAGRARAGGRPRPAHRPGLLVTEDLRVLSNMIVTSMVGTDRGDPQRPPGGRSRRSSSRPAPSCGCCWSAPCTGAPAARADQLVAGPVSLAQAGSGSEHTAASSSSSSSTARRRRPRPGRRCARAAGTPGRARPRHRAAADGERPVQPADRGGRRRLAPSPSRRRSGWP